MEYIYGAIIFLFGAALGSFIAVIGARYNTGLSFLKGRSACFSCNAVLKKRDLIPLFSFLFLKGRCRYCNNKIPKETLIIEILMGILSIMAALKSEFLFQDFSLMSVASYLLLTAIFAVILLIAMYDLRHFIIPDSFLVSFFVLSFLYLSIFPSFNFSFAVSSLLSAIILALPFLLIFLVSKGTWFGFGDVKYILILSFFLGFGQGLSAIILSFWIGAAFSLAALSFKRIAPHINLPLFKNSLTMKSEIPFGPFLSIGIIISFYFNADLFQIHSFFSTL
jgi:leader peptidase (prepilin peptidase)/N-methyltransferase